MIINPNRFAEAKPANFDGIFDWDFLLPAFAGTKIQPTDIDAVIERKGKLLLFETKEDGKKIPSGQIYTFNALLKLGKGNIHLLIIYGKTKETIKGMQEWYFAKGEIRQTEKVTCDYTTVLARVKKWFAWANK